MSVNRGAALRWVLVGYAAYAAADAIRISFIADPYTFTPVAAVCLPIAAVLALVLAYRLDPDGRSRGIAWFVAAMIAVQFLIAFGTFSPWIGLLLCVTALALTKPSFPQLRPRTRKLALTLHVGFSVSWLGLAMSMTVLSGVGLLAVDGELQRDAYRMMHIFDLALVIPLVILSILTGLLVSLGTKWGLIRHWWVLTKFTISMTILAVAAFFENFWVRGLAERLSTDPSAEPAQTGVQLFVCMATFSLLLWTATVLSVYKPWGRTRWGRRALQRSTQRRTGTQKDDQLEPHTSQDAPSHRS